ncbi:UTP--glucose-1-phosphate uridylyltransferase [Candidatus Acidianus copahuensis]|uniref:UTP--glucose-1-phosphate uridylyltransferase n=1 Tax=Candidatus Acidianus copahuensis TaxID=1160895 RepID=A0A031LK03_9CREN|nr:sugar phosphate nucleotidyltransferase [Candidatus Acidianus copahuensis]EZQ01564.1 UTP--glucose-1-phosphate uridylyltransferase [Candidatus Acidianus copahuensis]
MQGVITAAGLGTRMLPVTKVIPKEMLPVLFKGEFKPIIHIVFEQLYTLGIRDFIIVVGRGKRTIEDYFTPDYNFVQYLESVGKVKQAQDLMGLYKKVEESSIAFVNQPEPKGFGDAVLRSKPFVHEDFMVVAPDTLLLSIPKMPINSITVTKVDDPRIYGVVTLEEGDMIKDIEEKPNVPKSNIAVMPYYHFDLEIFNALESIFPVHGELQLTEGIRELLRRGKKFKAIFVEGSYDMGDLQKYIVSLKEFLSWNGAD